MTDHIIEIADTAAFLSYENHLLKLKIPNREPCSIPVAEILCLILANPAVSLTGALLTALAENNTMVVISNDKCMPVAIQLPLAGNYVQTERFHAQIDAPEPLRKRLWQTVVKQKISAQANLLLKLHGDDFGILKLLPLVMSGDSRNIEGRAAAIYWKHLFPTTFLRDRGAQDANMLLNYGYAVLRAITARACCAAGLHPTIGINHHNKYDSYCLADDLMEPFRPVIDGIVVKINPDNAPIPDLTSDLRRALLSAILQPQPTSRGMWHIHDILKSSAEKVARSFVERENLLVY